MRVSGQPTTVVSTKGQVILPKAIRQGRHWTAGTRLIVEETADGVLLRVGARFPPTTIDDVFGCPRYEGAPLTLDEMDAAIEEEARRHAGD